MARTLTADELAVESGSPVELVHRLVAIGALEPAQDRFRPGDVIRVQAVQAFMESGLGLHDLEVAVAEGLFTFAFLDAFYREPAPPSGNTYAAFAGSLGPRARLLPGIYAAMGLPEPRPSAMLRADEEEILVELLDTWSEADDEETYARAARLVGEPARIASQGWVDLYAEKILPPILSGKPSMQERIAAIARTAPKASTLVPKMLLWLQQQHLRTAIDQLNFAAIEQRLAERGLAPPRPARLPAIAFVDIAGFTRMTLRHGDELAVRSAELLRERADRVARGRGGRLVKLLGDGAMLRFGDAAGAVGGALELVGRFADDRLSVHAGVHAGPMIERDGDYFGRTVNLASRIAAAAAPGEVIVTDAVVSAAGGGGCTFQPLGPARLKGVDEPVELFRAVTGG